MRRAFPREETKTARLGPSTNHRGGRRECVRIATGSAHALDIHSRF
ncbi:MAG: hypothetical protein AAF791_15090 [Bacteroidota bacterium]